MDISRFGRLFPSRSDAFLILYDALSRKTFEKAIKIYKHIKDCNFGKEGTVFILIRSKYELNKTVQNNFKDFISDEEVLKFAEKNNLFFSHISSFEQHESGIKELFSLILKRLFIIS